MPERLLQSLFLWIEYFRRLSESPAGPIRGKEADAPAGLKPSTGRQGPSLFFIPIQYPSTLRLRESLPYIGKHTFNQIDFFVLD